MSHAFTPTVDHAKSDRLLACGPVKTCEISTIIESISIALAWNREIVAGLGIIY